MPTVTERARSVVAGETVAAMVAAHRAGASVEATVARAYARVRAHNDPAIFITLREEADAMTEAKALAGKRGADRAVAELPLYGVPVAIKDNIDVAGLPTTAACPAFAYVPEKDATCVARLKRAGAIVIGKTNLDQFATGLEGVRTPYGIPRNLFDKALIPGGSSAGSAVAIAAGLGPRAGGAEQHGGPQAEPRAGLECRRGAGLPHARLRLRARAHRRGRIRRARRDRRARPRRSVLAQASAERARRRTERRAGGRAAAGAAPLLRRRRFGRSL